MAYSKTEQYLTTKGWLQTAKSSDGHAILEFCPLCNKGDYKFYIRIDADDPENDGVWDCKHGSCQEAGNLWQLQERMGDLELRRNLDNVEFISIKDWGAKSEPQPLPNPDACHMRLVNDMDALDYVMNTRGFSRKLIDERKLGMAVSNGVKWLVIPYFNAAGQIVFAKYRKMPPHDKEKPKYVICKGHEIRLFNEACLSQDMDELILIEGELNALALIDNGVTNVVGIPGAGTRKMEWLKMIDWANPKKLYTVYDPDAAGDKGEQEMFKRMMLNTRLTAPLGIKIPPFEDINGEQGKDFNDWFRAGYTAKEFEELKKNAVPIVVKGVTSLVDALENFERQVHKGTIQPTYVTQWDVLNPKIGGFDPGDVIDIIAPGKVGKTTFVLNLIDYLVAQYNEPALIECLEMQADKLARKWASMVTRTDDSPPLDGEDAKLKLETWKTALPLAKEIARGRTADLLFGHSVVKDAEEVFDIFRQAVRRYGVKFIVLDNLQLLVDLTMKNYAHRTAHMSHCSKMCKSLAMELGVVMFRIIQPRSIPPGEVVSHKFADGSSQIEKDCDASISLHRPEKMKVKADDLAGMSTLNETSLLEPQLHTRVTISRYAPGGHCVLKFEGQYSLVTEWTPDEMSGIGAAMNASLLTTTTKPMVTEV